MHKPSPPPPPSCAAPPPPDQNLTANRDHDDHVPDAATSGSRGTSLAKVVDHLESADSGDVACNAVAMTGVAAASRGAATVSGHAAAATSLGDEAVQAALVRPAAPLLVDARGRQTTRAPAQGAGSGGQSGRFQLEGGAVEGAEWALGNQGNATVGESEGADVQPTGFAGHYGSRRGGSKRHRQTRSPQRTRSLPKAKTEN